MSAWTVISAAVRSRIAAFSERIVQRITPYDFLHGLDLESAGRARLTSPYQRSAWVMRAIKTIAGNISPLPLRFSEQRRRSEVLLEDTGLTLWWERPAVGLNWSDFIEAVVGWLKLEGEAFLVLDDTYLMARPPAPENWSPLLVVRPNRMEHVVRDGKLDGWIFTDGSGRRHSLLLEQVIQIKLWNPYDDYRGLPEYASAELAAEADYLQGRFARNLAANNGDQGVYIVAKGGIPTDAQRDQIITQLRAKRAAQQRGEFRPIFLSGDISVEQPGIRAPDANFVTQRLHNRHEIFLAFGVPPSMADIVASYSIGSASDRFRLIEDTCMPTAAKICDAIEQVLRRQLGRQVYCWIDWDEHSVMQQIRAERVQQVQALFGVGMPVRAINDWLGLGLPEFDGWDVGYLPFGIAPVGSLPPDQSAAYSELLPPDVAPPPAAALQAPRKRDAYIEIIEHDQGCPHCRVPVEIDERAPEAQLWRSQMAKQRVVFRAYHSKFLRELMKMRAQVLAKLQAASNKTHAEIRAGAAAEFLFNLGDAITSFLGAMRRVTTTAIERAGQDLRDEVGITDPFKLHPKEAQQFLRQRENKLKNVPQEIFERIRDRIDNSLERGDTMEEIADGVREEFNGIGRYRSMVIARTETTAAYGWGRQQSMTTAGVGRKRWLSSHGPNVRQAHAAAERAYASHPIPVSEPFIVGGERLMHPGDPAGSPGNVINCQCVSIAVP